MDYYPEAIKTRMELISTKLYGKPLINVDESRKELIHELATLDVLEKWK